MKQPAKLAAQLDAPARIGELQTFYRGPWHLGRADGQRMAPLSFKHVVGRASWEVHAHRYATRAWRAASSGHILDKSSPFAKVVAHLLLIVNLTFRGRASR